MRSRGRTDLVLGRLRRCRSAGASERHGGDAARFAALGTAALLLLHVILCIGPLCRLDRRFLPLLYNRRHLGVTMFLLALAHGTFSIFQFHALGNLNPLVSLLCQQHELRQPSPTSRFRARVFRAGDSVCDGRDEPRFLVAQPDCARVEAPAYAGVLGLRAADWLMSRSERCSPRRVHC